MAITSGEVITLRARFFSGGVAVDVAEPVEFRVRKRTKTATVSAPIVAAKETTGVWAATHTTGSKGTYDYSVETSAGVIEEGSFYVSARKA